jgi:hypothetical protein
MATENDTKPNATPSGTGDDATQSGNPTATTQTGAEPKTGDSQPNTGQPDSEQKPNESGEPTPKPEKLMTATEVAGLIAREIGKAEEKWKAKRDEEQAEKDGKWHELAETRKASLETLQGQFTTLESNYSALTSAFTVFVRSELLALPESVRAAAPVDLPEKAEELESFEINSEALATLGKWLPKGKKLALEIDGGDPSQPGYTGKPKPKRGELPTNTTKKTTEQPGGKASPRYSM